VSKAKQVTDRIEAVETVGDKLFVEWNAELDQYTDPKLRSLSESQMNDARNRYDELLRVMRNAESKMPPVLDQLRNQVLFLKHNLNASAIAGLGEIALDVQNDVASLIAEMETAIREANAFIETLAGA
jgi:septation ring formation regulator EzrA